MTDERSYGSPNAFRRALTDRLRAVAREGRWDLAQLQRQMAYDRLLERLYFVDDGWIVKGAAALLARELGVRASIDLDVYLAKAGEVAERQLRDAAARDIGDWFRFAVGPNQPASDGSHGLRLPVVASVGATVWARFHVDLVGSEIVMTGTPEDVPPLVRVAIPDVEQHGYRAYPLVDHIADKVAAMFQRYGEQEQPSTRFRDLVDLVAIISGATVEASAQTTALRSEEQRRRITLPQQFDVPDRNTWEGGYAREANASLLPGAKTLDEALGVVRPFIDPLLQRSATGHWNPGSARWDQ
ncbi:MAG: nucleotidyl transferase AbiEii/AbiGii toxin family protein [Thermoleophilia bacterium]